MFAPSRQLVALLYLILLFIHLLKINLLLALLFVHQNKTWLNDIN